jgi:hypothetical protein
VKKSELPIRVAKPPCLNAMATTTTTETPPDHLEEHKSIIMSPVIEKDSLVLVTGVSGYSTHPSHPPPTSLHKTSN